MWEPGLIITFAMCKSAAHVKQIFCQCSRSFFYKKGVVALNFFLGGVGGVLCPSLKILCDILSSRELPFGRPD